MADTKTGRKILSQKRFAGGISDYTKENAAGQIPDSFYFSKAINYRDDPQALTLLPGAVKESGSVVTDLLKWADIVPTSLTSYLYGNAGNIYSRTSAGSWSNLHTVPSSHGNGLAYFTGDDYVYYTADSSIGRYGPTQNSPQFTDNFLKAQGGVPLNTYSLSLVAASSQYATAADSVSLSITSDLTLEAYFYANSLPNVGNSMTLLGKWDESGALRSYKLDLYGVSGYFGNGTDGSLTISSNTTEVPIDATCTGTAGTQTLSATNASFAQGQVILIHQTQGTNAGQWERNTIQGYTAGTITLGTKLIGSYASGAQVRVLKQYTNVTVNSSQTWTAKAWNGSTGGILAFLANGTVAVNGTITANGGNGTQNTGSGSAGAGTGGGFRGGNAIESLNNNVAATGQQGESANGLGGDATGANGNGGGGGYSPGGNSHYGAGGGGGYGAAGGNGTGDVYGGSGGSGGGISGSNDLTTMLFGAGGGGGAIAGSGTSGGGGAGGGIVFIIGVTITNNGAITSNGGNGADGGNVCMGGGGAGGSILIKCQTASLGSGLITANGGAGGTDTGGVGGSAGSGGSGRIAVYYLTSYTGSTTPSADFIQDNTLVTTTTIQARLGISNDGTTFEYLTQNLSNLTTATWNRLSVAWTASTSTAQFYVNGNSIGSSTGTKTAIHDNTSLLYLGANKGASVVQNFFDGLIDDVRIWSAALSSSTIYTNNNIQVNGSAGSLNAYYELNNAYTDLTSNGNTLTAVNSPTFSTNVPFSAATTRLDIDTQNTNTGQTYTLPTSIIEDSVDTLNFTPVNDPQASVGFYVNAKGTGNWTVTVHDQQNRVIATQTINNANIPASGFVEFIFSTPWRLITKDKYHMHLTVSTGTSSIVSGTLNDFSTAEYATYFGWLVTDTQFHPIVQFQYQPLGGTLTGAMIIGNERYLAVWDGATYSPNFVTFSPGWKVRCFGFWRQYLAVGVWKGTNIYDYQQGRIYFYSGYAPAFDFFIDVPEGPINALFGVDSDLYMFAGYRGILLDYKGGFFYNTGNSASNKLKRMPLIPESSYVEVFPGALTMWRGYLHFGLFGNSDSAVTNKGVWSYGSLNQWYPDTLSYDYPISTGNSGSSVSIGLVYPVGQNLVIGWQDGTGYGADVINFHNAPAPQGELQMMIFDNGNIWKNERSFQAKADFLPLKAGEGVTVEYNPNREGWTESDKATTDSIGQDTFTKLVITSGLTREVQLGAKLYATGSTSPTLLGISLLYNDTGSEEQF